MARPTIPDLALASGVSISTVNRVLGGSGKVRKATMQRVLEAAEEIGFYGVGSIQSRISATRPRDRFIVFLQQSGRAFYETIGSELKRAAQEVEGRDVSLSVRFMEDLSPDKVAETLVAQGMGADAVAVVAADHPLIADAIDRLAAEGVPVTGLVTPLNARCNVGFVGLDAWKVGRTAGWAFDHICRDPGKIGILVGSHRFRNHDLNESGFRSYFREYGRAFTLLDPLSTFESSRIARELTEELLAEHPDLVGLYVSGGGITGAVAALRAADMSGKIVVVGYDLFEATKAALLDQTITFLISHPFRRMAQDTIQGLIRSKEAGVGAPAQRVILDFEIYTRENI